MKKLILILFIFTIPLHSIHALEISGKGIKAGVNVSKLISDDFAEEPESFASLTVGGFLRTPLTSRFSIQSELFISAKGGTWQLDQMAFNPYEGYYYNEETYKITYIEVPILARIDFPGEPISVAAYGGPSVALKIDTSILQGRDGQVFEEVDANGDDVTSTDAGIVFGIAGGMAGYGLDIRYTHGLVDIWKAEEYQMTNSAIAVLLSFGF
jgi:hypothetical protein